MKRLILAGWLSVVLILAFPMTVFASESADGRIVFGGTFTLKSGEVLDGDLAVVGGSAYLEEESTVTGSVVVLGGNLDAYGQIDGDVILVGGNANLGPYALIKGDVVMLGGNVSANEAQIEGDLITGSEYVIPFDFEDMDFRFDFGRIIPPFPGTILGIEGRVLSYLFVSFMMTAVAVLTMLFWSDSTRQVASVVVGKPVAAGGLGLLTLFVVFPLLVLLMITICLIPASLLGFLILGLAWVFGVVALGYEVGNRLGLVLNQEFQPVMAAGLGTLILSLIVGGLYFIPCFGSLISLFIGAFGLGAVLLTRFGSRPYPYIETDVSPPSLADEMGSLPDQKSEPSTDDADSGEAT